MDAFRIHVKAYLRGPLPARDFGPVFHRFIQRGALAERMIDVTDYSHVHHGPGVGLICHEANYFTDESDGRIGLLYARKRPLEGDFATRLDAALEALLACARHLENDPALAGRAVFGGEELRIALLDRLLAPNQPATFAAIAGPLSSLATRLWPGATVVIGPCAAPREPFAVRLASPARSSVTELLQRLA